MKYACVCEGVLVCVRLVTVVGHHPPLCSVTSVRLMNTGLLVLVYRQSPYVCHHLSPLQTLLGLAALLIVVVASP